MHPLDLLDEFYDMEYSSEEIFDSYDEDFDQENEDDQILGKRKFGGEAPIVKKVRPKKYLDPVTGAYYDDIQEFNKIRALWELRKTDELCYQKNILKKFFIVKKKKISFQIFDKNN